MTSLNPQQSDIVGRLHGDTFVTAGAGSGKTRVLAERFVAVVLSGASPSEQAEMLRRILLITFTDKAAGELGERVRRVLLRNGRADLARAVDQAWISTIHGFCGRIVRRHALELGVDPGFGVLADPQTGVVRQQAFERAVAALAESDPDVAELLDLHTVDGVRAATASGLDQIRAMGLTPSSLATPGAPDCRAALERAVWALRELVPAYRELPGHLKVVEANLPVLEQLDRHVATLSELDADGLARALIACAAAYPLRKPGGVGEPTRSLTERALEVLDELVRTGVEAVCARHADAYARVIAAYSEAYEESKAQLGALDFEDLQLLAARLFEQEPGVAARYAERFVAAMVDEFQDTNDLQLRVVCPITDGSLCVVGDEKQSIYGFRFADVDVFRTRGRAQLDADPDGYRPLQVNYRTHPDVLAALNELFDGPPFFEDGYLPLLPGRDAGWRIDPPPGVARTEVLLVDRAGWEDVHWRDAEARAIAERVVALVESGVEPGDIVVLMRQMTTARPYVRALERVGLDVYAESSGGFFATAEVADVRALLSVLANPRDDEAVVALLAGGLGGVTDDALYRLTRLTDGPGSLWTALARADGAVVSEADAARCALVRETVERLRSEQGRTRLADMVLDAAAILGPGGGCLSGETAWANVRKVARLAADFERVAQADPGAFLRHLAEREVFVKREAAASVAGEGSRAIRIMTVHAAKGLEFPVVIVADLGHAAPADKDTLSVVKTELGPVAAVRLPTSAGKDLPRPESFERARAMTALRAEEEEKRVFYVACTRAEELLVLSGGARLDAAPSSSTLIDLLRRAVGDAQSPRIAGIRVTEVRAGDEVPGSPVRVRPAGGHARTRAEEPRTEVPGERRGASPVPPADLSYTALALFERCAYRFYAERVLGVGSPDEEGAGDDAKGLGVAVHAALQLEALGRPADDARLDAIARRNGLDATARERLCAAVRTFRGSEAARAVASGAARPEVNFAVRLDAGTLVGTLDLHVRGDDGDLVIDYKTGTGALDAASARRRYEHQAEVYALALLKSGAPAVSVRFIEVEREGRLTCFDFVPADEGRVEARIAALFDRISAADYPRLSAFDHDTCRGCPVSGGLCPVVRPGTKRARNRA